MSWPPPYTIRRSSRARRIALRMDAKYGLEIVLPQKKNATAGLIFLNEQRAWVEKNIQRLKINTQCWLEANDRNFFPDQLILLGMEKTIELIYQPELLSDSLFVNFSDNQFVFHGRIKSFSDCLPSIINRLKKIAKTYLDSLLKTTAREYGFSYRKISIRGQKTVWGSCTADKNIQLNYKLLFLPKLVAQYVLIHELCHTKHLNHSVSFWKLVESCMPDYRDRRKRLRQADQLIPWWLGSSHQ